MSLEQALIESTQAVKELTALILKLNSTPVSVPASPPPTSPPVVTEDKPAKKTKAAKKEEPITALETEGVTYDQVKDAILALSKAKGRDAVVKLLTQFGAAKGPDLKPEQYAEFHKAAEVAANSSIVVSEEEELA